MNTILAMAAGGAVGAVLRHYVAVFTVSVTGLTFPWGTISVNVIGSFFMGVIVTYFAHATWDTSLEIRGFLIVGLLGAFTTFSTFSLDAVNLYERGAVMASMGYILASVILSIGGLFAGVALIRQLVS